MAWSLSSAGLVAPASFSNSADANTLDDYEEGLHTWSISAASGANYQPRVGYTQWSYSKIGDLCNVRGKYENQGTYQSSGQSARWSLPFTIKANQNSNATSNFMSNIAVRNHGVAGSSYTNGYIDFYLVGDANNAYCALWGIESNAGVQEVLLVGTYGSGSFEFDTTWEGAVNFCFPTAA